jgi:hypothetical protein
VQGFGLIETMLIAEALQRKASRRKIVNRLQKFQARFDRELEKPQRVIDETFRRETE